MTTKNLICSLCDKPIVYGQGWDHHADTNTDFHPECRMKLPVKFTLDQLEGVKNEI